MKLPVLNRFRVTIASLPLLMLPLLAIKAPQPAPTNASATLASQSYGNGHGPYSHHEQNQGPYKGKKMKVTNDAVLDWNQIALTIVADGETHRGPGFPTRSLAIVHAAIYDAVNAILRKGTPYLFSQKTNKDVDVDIAVAGAAATALKALYPAQTTNINLALEAFLDGLRGRSSHKHARRVEESLTFGADVAQVILTARQSDGANDDMTYNAPDVPGIWQPTLPDFTPAWGPTWGNVTLFALPNREDFLPPAPPALSSEEYAEAVAEVQAIGKFDSSVRTPEQTLIALFWSYDRLGLGSPAVLYNDITRTIAAQKRNSLFENARLLALANFAMADAAIVTWTAKYSSNLWRPVDAVRGADADGNPETNIDPTWLPLGIASAPFTASTITPPFPAYTSGHATIAAAAFRVIQDFYGTDKIRFAVTSVETPGVTRTFNRLSDATEENGQSRIYMGVHFAFDKTEGVESGTKIGDQVFNTQLRPRHGHK